MTQSHKTSKYRTESQIQTGQLQSPVTLHKIKEKNVIKTTNTRPGTEWCSKMTTNALLLITGMVSVIFLSRVYVTHVLLINLQSPK